MENLGSYLKSKREERGIALEEIASITKIHVRSIQLIEHSEWKSLPPEPFIRGFLSAYSRYVGLDPKEVLDRYVEETKPLPVIIPGLETSVEYNENTDEDAVEKTLNYELPKKNHQWKIWSGAIAAAALLIVVPFLLRDKGVPPTLTEKSAQEESKEVLLPATVERESVQSLVTKATPEKIEPIVEQVESVKELPKEPTTTEARTIANALPVVEQTAATPSPFTIPPQTSAHTLTVKVKSKSWSKVVIDDAAPVQKTLSPDEIYTYNADTKIKIVLGNTAGAEVLHNGEKASGLKINGTIRQYIFPKKATFPQDPPKRKVATPETDVVTEVPISAETGLLEEEKEEEN